MNHLPTQPLTVLLANPRGWCAGVRRAVETLEVLLAQYGPPLYVSHPIVHNQTLLDSFQARGVRFCDTLDEVPDGARLVLSAHGSSPTVQEAARARASLCIDAVCPLVERIHRGLRRVTERNASVVLIGHAAHPEILGTKGHYQGQGTCYVVGALDEIEALPEALDDGPLSFFTQTTLSVLQTAELIARLKARFPQIQGPPKADICYATTARQQAVLTLLPQVELLLVVGTASSSNGTRLLECGLEQHRPSYLIEDGAQLSQRWFNGIQTVGVTAAASTPESSVQSVIAHLKRWYCVTCIETEGTVDDRRFPLPKSLTAVVS